MRHLEDIKRSVESLKAHLKQGFLGYAALISLVLSVHSYRLHLDCRYEALKSVQNGSSRDEAWRISLLEKQSDGHRKNAENLLFISSLLLLYHFHRKSRNSEA